jgi:hypothetical protein
MRRPVSSGMRYAPIDRGARGAKETGNEEELHQMRSTSTISLACGKFGPAGKIIPSEALV